MSVQTPMQVAVGLALPNCDKDLIRDRKKGCSLFNTKGKDIVKMEAKKCATLLFAALFAILLLSTGCKHSSSSEDEDLVGDWFKRSDFEGVPRSSAAVFTIGDKAYVGLGYDGENRLTDFWQYDPQLNNWTRKKDFPGAARNGAVAFSIDPNGYVGTGYDGTNRLKDFYKYDPSTDSWVQIADFGGTARYGAVAFSIGTKGYVATGDDGSFLKDLWEYDPLTNQWTQKVSLGGSKRRNAVAFVVDGKAYVCTGVDNGVYEDDLWEYDPSSGLWTGKRSIANVSDESYDDKYSDIVGTNKVAFSISGKGYVVTGGSGTTGNSVWEYDPSTDLWQQKTSFEGTSRMEAVGFVLGSYTYVSTGRNGSYYFDDLWGFGPGAEQGTLSKQGFIVSP
jgi:N-acetylneuraminic acid mutarotase